MSAESTLVFIHIPRTGASAVRTALSSAYGPQERAFLYEAGVTTEATPPTDFDGLIDADRARLSLVMGTFPFGLHATLPLPSRYATIVRHPLDRAISMYSSDADLPGSPGERPSLLDWLEQQPQGVDNGMVRLIAGRDGVPFGQCPDDLLAEAVEHINESFDAVLVRGRLSRSEDILQRLTGRSVGTIRRRNVTEGRMAVSDLEPPTRARLTELNQLDLRLFRAIADRADQASTISVQAPATKQPERSPEPVTAPVVPASSSSALKGSVAGPGLPVADRTLLFMHIAKTGGTSVRAALAKAYEKGERAFVYDPADLRGAVNRDQFAELPEETRQQLRLVMGHFQYGIHRSLDRPFRYVAVVRDPVDRVVSLYYHYLHLRGFRQGGPAREEQERMKRTGMSLEEWVFGQNRLALDNGMTRNLAARRRVRFGQCPQDLLDEAMEHVDKHFAALLVTDQLWRCTPLLETISGRSLKEPERVNVNRKRVALEDLDPRLLDKIRQLNHLDTRLYDTAKERLEPLLAPTG